LKDLGIVFRLEISGCKVCHNSSFLFIKLTNKSFTPFFGHLEPFSQDRKNGEAPGKTVTGFAGRKKT
jgi:hypothetical protein